MKKSSLRNLKLIDVVNLKFFGEEILFCAFTVKVSQFVRFVKFVSCSLLPLDTRYFKFRCLDKLAKWSQYRLSIIPHSSASTSAR